MPTEELLARCDSQDECYLGNGLTSASAAMAKSVAARSAASAAGSAASDDSLRKC